MNDHPMSVIRPIEYGVLASALLIALYALIVGAISGINFAQEQFLAYWYFIVTLAIGFGIQVGLYVYARALVKNGMGGAKVLGVTGATSTVAMVSCCAHYLANILPILGVAGALTVVASYQTELFWAGIVLNLAGIAYIANKVIKLKKHL